MLQYVCDFAFGYTTEDFENILNGIGMVGLAVGTIMAGIGAILIIPRTIAERHKDDDLIKLYQKVVYRMYRTVEASAQGITFSLPGDFAQLAKLLHEQHSDVGSQEDAEKMMTVGAALGYLKGKLEAS